MTITATISDGVFTIAGESEARPGRVVKAIDSGFAIDDSEGLFRPEADDERGERFEYEVPVDRDGSVVRVIDASGVTGAGVEIQNSSRGVDVVMSGQDDVYFGDADGSTVLGGAGDDLMFCDSNDVDAPRSAQTLSGGAGDDTMLAGKGDDRLEGGAGDDGLNGGVGFDVAVFSGSQADYAVSVEDGAYVVRDLRAEGGDGVDRIVDVEQLQFADGTLDLSPISGGLTATAKGGTLTISGEAGRDGDLFFPFVLIENQNSPLVVRDYGNLLANIPITDDGVDVRAIDARGLEGSGVRMIFRDETESRAFRFFGSEQGDFLIYDRSEEQGDARVVLLGNGGDDVITDFGEQSYLGGGRGDDSMRAFGFGDDTLIGGRGDDTLEGSGRGTDVALYNGRMSDYVVSFENGAYVVTDLRPGRDGVDVLRGIEQLRFSDGVMDVPAPRTELEATLDGGVLTVTGEAASDDEQVEIDVIGRILSIGEGDGDGAPVPVDGDGSEVRVIDIRGLTGGGADIRADGDAAVRVFGSAQDDRIVVVNMIGGRNVVLAGDGDDDVFGDDSRDAFVGGGGDDILVSSDGADTLTGGMGDDSLDGGADFDVAVFSGDRANYLIEQIYDSFRVTDLRDGYNGVDLIKNIEQLQFKDGTFDVASFFAVPEEALI